jgi:DNA-binding XRE family transcriptional regulator
VTKSWESIRTEKLESMSAQERRRYDQRKAEVGRAVRLGLEVKARREAAGLSQRQLADIVGIRQPNIARLEAGDVLPTLGTLDRIADALGLTLEVCFSTTSG